MFKNMLYEDLFISLGFYFTFNEVYVMGLVDKTEYYHRYINGTVKSCVGS